MHRDTVTRSWGPLLCHSSMTITSWFCTAPCCKDLYTIPGSWKHPSSCMASILTRHVTHWTCLGYNGSAYKTACSSSCQYPASWTNILQDTINNLINSIRRVAPPPPPPRNTVKLQILELPFIVASLRHTCAIIMLSIQQGLFFAGTSRIWIRHLRNLIQHLILLDPSPHVPMKDVCADL